MTQLALQPSPPQPAVSSPPTLESWLRAQAVNVQRHLDALRPFADGEFGTDAAAPTPGHLHAVNRLMAELRRTLQQETGLVVEAVQAGRSAPTTRTLQRMLARKERAHASVRAVEMVWDFFFELFGQRQSRFGDWLLSCDRIALDCYQTAFVNLGTARSIPAPAPFSYMRTGFSPATFRRNIPLRRLGRQLNPFGLIQLPFHRLVNPWTLGAILHEVSHNLQNDLGLAEAVPRRLGRRLQEAGVPPAVASVWLRWHREIYADLSGLLLGGPAVVASLIDVVGRSVPTVVNYLPRGPHPTPLLRPQISIELLHRMGFPAEADGFTRLWRRLYAPGQTGSIPRQVLDTYDSAMPMVVDSICFQPYPSLGGRSLSQVLRFGPKEQQLIEEAAGRVAAGIDPGVIPERFMIGAARVALDRRLAPAASITRHFYRDLARR
jgi:hypothetical protein